MIVIGCWYSGCIAFQGEIENEVFKIQRYQRTLILKTSFSRTFSLSGTSADDILSKREILWLNFFFRFFFCSFILSFFLLLVLLLLFYLQFDIKDIQILSSLYIPNLTLSAAGYFCLIMPTGGAHNAPPCVNPDRKMLLTSNLAQSYFVMLQKKWQKKNFKIAAIGIMTSLIM